NIVLAYKLITMQKKQLPIYFFLLTICSSWSINNMENTMDIRKPKNDIERVEPPHWWTGLNNSHLQLLVKEEGIGNAVAEISQKGVTIKKVTKGDSPNYLFIDLEISKDVEPGKFNIVFRLGNGGTKTLTYELKKRNTPSTDYVGFNSADVIYLITPDRFANGDPKNDIVPYLREKTID